MRDKVLVTGGSGFLGSSLVRRLLKKGNQVIVLDNGSRGSVSRLEDIIDKITYIKGDVCSKETVLEALKECQSLFHLAFINGTKFFYEQPKLVLDVGVKGALSTIEAAEELKIKNYIIASSSEVYQQPSQIPTPENERAIIPDVKNPRFSYAGGKLISELMTINYFRQSKIRDLIFRPHNVFGPNMGNEHVIPEIISKLKKASNNWTKKNVELEIQGSGMETRAFCFVEDAVDQIMMIYEYGLKGEIYHVGIDNEISINHLIKEISNYLELNVKIIKGKIKSGSTTRRCPNISKIKSIGYEKNDNFLKGLEETVFWYRDSLE